MPDLGRLQNYLPTSMPRPSIPSFRWSPRAEHQPNDSPASTSSPRFGALHTNVRSMVNGSSVYSDSPAPSNANTPKIPFLGFLRRPQSPPDPIILPDNDAPRDSSDSRSPLRPQHTAGSYMRAIGSFGTPREPETAYARHPADVQLDYNGSLDPETTQLQDELHGRRHRRHRRRRKHHRTGGRGGHDANRQPATHWVRRRKERGVCFSFMKSQPARGKCYACLISGLFLMTVLTIYLSLALTRKSLGQEVHVLFIMIILGTTIFFCHSLIRLCMLALHPEDSSSHPRIPDMTGPEGFQPIRPIRVHLARDEELGDMDDDAEDDADGEKEKIVKQPPPAYGLWRSSVRVDPNLLHWQRVEPATARTSIAPPAFPGLHSRANSHSLANSPDPSRNGSVIADGRERVEEEHAGPRPPSYVSDDGVSYVVEAAPRSVAPGSGVSDIHPAWRPGFAMSEVGMRIQEWPAPTRV